MEKNIQKVVERNCHFTHLGLLNEIVELIHPQSLSFSQSKQMLSQLFDSYQLNVKLKAFKYMGKDKAYAYARVQQETKKESEPEFKDNITDQLMVFKQDGEEWKIWTTAILNIKYLD